MTSEMADAVRSALAARPAADARDTAAAALAVSYAELIDRPAARPGYRDAVAKLHKVIAIYEGLDADEVVDALEVVAVALAEHSVHSDLGPKLLNTLTALGLTVAGRGKTTDGGGSGGVGVHPGDELKQRRARNAG